MTIDELIKRYEWRLAHCKELAEEEKAENILLIWKEEIKYETALLECLKELKVLKTSAVVKNYLDGYNQALNDVEDMYVTCMSTRNATIGCPGCDSHDSCIIPLVELLRE